MNLGQLLMQHVRKIEENEQREHRALLATWEGEGGLVEPPKVIWTPWITDTFFGFEFRVGIEEE